MRILGIDPGLEGALALLCDGQLSVFDIPTVVARGGTKRDVVWPEVARWIDAAGHIDHAIIEKTSAGPKMSKPSAFAFGYTCGGLHGLVSGHFIPITRPTTLIWKKALSVPKAKDGARARAIELFPAFSNLFVRVKDHDRAEAALMALWGAREITAGAA